MMRSGGEWLPIPSTKTFVANSSGVLSETVANLNNIARRGFKVEDLEAGVGYWFRVRAVNAVGGGRFVELSKPVYPGAIPAAPVEFAARPIYDVRSGVGRVVLSWEPGDYSGPPVDRWQFRIVVDKPEEIAKSAAVASASNPGGWRTICDNTMGADPGCGSRTRVTLPRPPGLFGVVPVEVPPFTFKPGPKYYFVVRGLNAFYKANDDANTAGFASAAINVSFDKAVPSKPSFIYVKEYKVVDDKKNVVLVPVGVANGGETVSGYEYSVKIEDGEWGPWIKSASSPVLVGGLQDGTMYAVRIRALNKLGAGDYAETPELTFGAPPHPGAKGVNTNDDPRVAKAPSLLALPGSLVPFNELTAFVVNAQAPISDRDKFLKPSTVTLRLSIPPATSLAPAFDFFGVSAETSDMGGGVDSNTRWEYSYSSGAGGFTDWLFVNEGAQFNGGTDYVVDGLVNGMFYTFRVRAINPRGPDIPDLVGPYLQTPATIPGIPGIPPGAPLNARAVAGDSQITVSWVPGNSGGFPLDSWQYCLYDIDEDPTTPGRQGSHTPGCTWTKIPNSNAATTSHTFTGLTNGWAYTYQIRALNVIGAFVTKLGSGALAQTLPTVPGRPPGAPTNTVVQPGDGQVTIWAAGPSDTGGNPVIAYQVRKKHSGGAYDAWETLGTMVSPTSPRPSAEQAGAVVRNLINGASYTFQVRARNALGAGPEKQTATVIPIGAPTPGQLEAEPDDRQVTLTWTPGSPAGSVVTGWQYRQKQANTGYGPWTDIARSGPNTRTHTITGLSNGITYTFQTRNLTNNPQVNGNPFESQPVTPATTPPAPQLTATPGNRTVTLSWTPGASEPAGQPGYSAPVTGWEYRTRAGTDSYGDWTNIDGSDATTTNHTINDLTNGTIYTIELRASNVIGKGATTTVSAIPATGPEAPTVTVTATDRTVVLSWTPGDNGGSPVTGWQMRIDDGEWVDLNAETGINSVPVPNLVNGTTYTFEVRAVNATGVGAAGEVSATPATVPGAPVVTAAGADRAVVLSWTPGDNGGFPVTGWQLRIDDGEWVDLDIEAGANGVSVPDLVNGTTYKFAVRAVNAAGVGAAGEVSAIPLAVPPAPEVDVVAGDGEVILSWVSTGDAGSPIMGWQYRIRIGAGDYLDWVDVPASTTTVSLSGLNGGTGLLAYTFQVRAINAAGNGVIATSPPITLREPVSVGENYYSGTITGASFCAELSLGGPRLFPLDSDGDGIADVCSLPYTRREAIARQNAVRTLASRYLEDYTALVNTICATLENNQDETCGGETLNIPGSPPANDGGPYYSGSITGPTYCANRSLGGLTTYPLDSDGDGVADTCSLPYTRREAIARQIAGDTLAATHRDEYRSALAEECRRLGLGDYGDNPQDLSNDICAP